MRGTDIRELPHGKSYRKDMKGEHLQRVTPEKSQPLEIEPVWKASYDRGEKQCKQDKVGQARPVKIGVIFLDRVMVNKWHVDEVMSHEQEKRYGSCK